MFFRGGGLAACTNQSGYTARCRFPAALMKMRSPAERLINSALSLKVERGQFPQNRPELERLVLSLRLINTNTMAFIIRGFFPARIHSREQI